jgi:hypothetical protein
MSTSYDEMLAGEPSARAPGSVLRQDMRMGCVKTFA